MELLEKALAVWALAEAGAPLPDWVSQYPAEGRSREVYRSRSCSLTRTKREARLRWSLVPLRTATVPVPGQFVVECDLGGATPEKVAREVRRFLPPVIADRFYQIAPGLLYSPYNSVGDGSLLRVSAWGMSLTAWIQVELGFALLADMILLKAMRKKAASE